MSDIDLNRYKQQFTKIPSFLSHEEDTWPCEVIDISLQGCLLSFKNTWEQHNIEAIYTLTLKPSTDNPIVLNLSISHVIDNEVSFKCEHIDLDHGKRLQCLAGTAPEARSLFARELLELAHPD